MSLFKKKISEQKVASEFVSMKLKEAEETWPVYRRILKDANIDRQVENENKAVYDLFLALVSEELRALFNLFSLEQAKRINKWIITFLDSPQYGEYARSELEAYTRTFEYAVQHFKEPAFILMPVPERLVNRWLGQEPINFDEALEGKGKLLSPLLIGQVSIVFANSMCFWKNIKNNFKPTENP